ncbi:MAG: hypothetical protein CVU70_03855, partial [Deltaproteobacteria bacterium HGW-Deltaproteobacteria-5]
MNDHQNHPIKNIVQNDLDAKKKIQEISSPESQEDNPIDYRKLYEQAREREALLRQSLIKYETLLDEVEDPISEVDLKGTITYSNNAAYKIWGIPKEQTIGKNYKSWTDPANQKIAY